VVVRLQERREDAEGLAVDVVDDGRRKEQSSDPPSEL
jgi:hypothetical protein